MDYKALLIEQNEFWLGKRAFLSKEDIAYLGNKKTLRGKMLGFLTSAYYKRTKLIKQGEILYSYVFKEWSNDVGGDDPQHPTWMLFSPSAVFAEHPESLKAVAEKLQGMSVDKQSDKKAKKLKGLLDEPLSDASYFEVPSEYTDGALVHLSIVYVISSLVPCFRLGLNLIIANQSVSKEVLYLPVSYWTDAYEKAYLSHELV